jgi:hypothetical protein
VAQGVDLEFKSQYCKKITERRMKYLSYVYVARMKIGEAGSNTAGD